MYFSTKKFYSKDCSEKSPTFCGRYEALKPLPCTCFVWDWPKNSVTLKAEMDLVELAAASFYLTHILCNWTACLCFWKESSDLYLCLSHFYLFPPMLKYFYLVQYYFLKCLPVKVIGVGYFDLIFLYWSMVMMKIQFIILCTW